MCPRGVTVSPALRYWLQKETVPCKGLNTSFSHTLLCSASSQNWVAHSRLRACWARTLPSAPLQQALLEGVSGDWGPQVLLLAGCTHLHGCREIVFKQQGFKRGFRSYSLDFYWNPKCLAPGFSGGEAPSLMFLTGPTVHFSCCAD